MNRLRLEQLARDWRRLLLVRDLLVALAVANGGLALALWRPVLFRWQLPLLALAGTFVLRLAGSRPWTLDPWRLSRHLDRTYPVLEESTALFLRPSAQLTLLERLQIRRVNLALSAHPGAPQPLGAPPHDFLRSASLSLAGTALLAAFSGLLLAGRIAPRSTASPLVRSSPPSLRTPPRPAAPLLPHIVGNTFTVTPPAYTGHPPRRVDGFTVEVEEGAVVGWDTALDHPVQSPFLTSGSDTFPLTLGPARHLQGSRTVAEPALFSLAATLPDGTAWHPSELFSVKVIRDRPPVVRLLQPDRTRTEIDPSASAPVRVEALVSDDYAVTGARLVATVAKGSGEAVRFREQSLPFDSDTPGDAGPLTRRFTRQLDLRALGLEPGDELYFFVEARDNRHPNPNVSRSETRFLTLRGPDPKKTTTGRGVAGVNLIPAYFRSERQLIIDTEKLVADRPTLPDAEVRTRSNDLGADQGFLRLRYGRFLGEDQEESALTDHLETRPDPLQARSPPPLAPGPRAAASIALRFEQEHVEQDREGGAPDDAPSRPPPGGGPLTADQVRRPFVDSHDSGDKPTFFDGETRGTMRDALDAMWTAEGLLRTIRPQEALAPEHRALEILKDLQQSARAYVQHVGFDAPPLKVAPRRLQGDAAGVPARTEVPGSLPPTDPALAGIRQALSADDLTDHLPADTLARIEEALTAAATRQPDDFLSGLQALRGLCAGGGNPAVDRPVLQRALLRLLPPAHDLPERSGELAPTLAPSYFRNLSAGEAARP